MSSGPDDLSDIFGAEPTGAAQPMSYRQGTVTKFNRATLENTVVVGGATFTDLPVLGVADAAALGPGSVVGLMAVRSTWAIVGRLVQPGTPEATDAITRVSQQIYTNTIATNETTSSITFTDLATVGPTVDVTIGASGRALVILSVSMAVPNKGGAMGFEISGASTLAASLIRSAALSDSDTVSSIGAFFSRVLEVSGLNPGLNTFTAKYVQTSGATPVGFQDRNITVFAF